MKINRDRMRGGRFKVFDDVSNDWWEEFRLYHRKDGRVVKENDDLLCATRYAIMMLRHARTPEAYNNFHRKIEMPEGMGHHDAQIRDMDCDKDRTRPRLMVH